MSKFVNIAATALVLLLPLSACRKQDQGSAAPSAGRPLGALKRYATGEHARCPVSGEDFVVAAGTVQVEHQGKHYAFCCADCAPPFTKNPTKYLQKN